MLELLAASSKGASPGPELYASSLFSLKHVVGVLTRWDTKTCGAKVKVSLGVECKVKAAYMGLLSHVYLVTKLAQLRDQVRQHRNGIWDAALEAPEDPLGPSRESLMHVVLADLKKFRVALNQVKQDGHTSAYLEEQDRYIFGHVLPALNSYFKLVGAGFGSCVSQAGWNLGHELHEELQVGPKRIP